MHGTEIVIENRQLGFQDQGLLEMIIRGKIAQTALPGQFVFLKAGPTQDPLLRRPLSIARIDRKLGEIALRYRVSGQGTKLLSQLKEGEEVDILGPLGNGFSIPEKGKLLLLAGGIGIFPLLSIIEEVQAHKAYKDLELKIFWGGEDKRFLESAGLKELRAKNLDCKVSTLDGSLGRQGLLTDLLNDFLTGSDNGALGEVEAVACGPKGMLKAVTEICLAKKIPLQVSLEERMACGIGACLGCVCTVQEGSDLARKRVCKEGPVFEAREVVWDV
ncbi:MAG: dihydroorotate dehydrogenase electron transfer subunit [Desulfitobacteriia bacterium]|jgi:dihydroorotate dehydrogenase electron transfer subunit